MSFLLRARSINMEHRFYSISRFERKGLLSKLSMTKEKYDDISRKKAIVEYIKGICHTNSTLKDCIQCI